MSQRKNFLLPAIAITCSLLVACGGGDDSGGGRATGDGTENGIVVQKEGESREDYLERLYEAAKEEGTVSYYQSANDDEVQEIIKAWNAAYPGIGFEPVSATSGTILERALLEAQSGNVRGDVYGGGAGDQAALEKAGALENYRPVNEADVIEEFQMEGPYIAIGTLTFHSAFNTKLTTEDALPDEWMGYCDEKWRGQIAIDQEAGEWVTGILTGMGKDAGMEFLKCLAANEPRLVRGSTNRTELLASGEFPVMLDGYGHRLWEFEQQGASVRVQRPSPSPLPVVLDMAGMFKDAPHPNAARLLMEFFLTAEGQQVFLDQNKPGTLTTQKEPYAEFLEGADIAVLGPAEANFDEGFKIFADLFLGGRVSAP